MLCLESKILFVKEHVLSFIPGVVVGRGGVVVGGGGVPEKIINIKTNHTQAVCFVVKVSAFKITKSRFRLWKLVSTFDAPNPPLFGPD